MPLVFHQLIAKYLQLDLLVSFHQFTAMLWLKALDIFRIVSYWENKAANFTFKLHH